MPSFSSNIDITSGGTYAMDITNGESSAKVATDINGKFNQIQTLLQNQLPEVWTGSSLPDSLPSGKIISYNNQLYTNQNGQILPLVNSLSQAPNLVYTVNDVISEWSYNTPSLVSTTLQNEYALYNHNPYIILLSAYIANVAPTTLGILFGTNSGLRNMITLIDEYTPSESCTINIFIYIYNTKVTYNDSQYYICCHDANVVNKNWYFDGMINIGLIVNNSNQIGISHTNVESCKLNIYVT